MNEENLLKLLEIVAAKVSDTRVKYSDTLQPQGRAFNEVKELMEALHEDPGRCERPYSEELPEDHSEIQWGWRVFVCKNHAHIIHLKFGYIVLKIEVAKKILVLGIP